MKGMVYLVLRLFLELSFYERRFVDWNDFEVVVKVEDIWMLLC